MSSHDLQVVPYDAVCGKNVIRLVCFDEELMINGKQIRIQLGVQV